MTQTHQCKISGCGGVVHCKELCHPHYDRQRYHGDPLAENMDRATHGYARSGKKTREWIIWSRMKGRCFNKRNPQYPHYGGRGVTVCERWLNFENFLADMGPRPSSEHSIDRYPSNDGNYEPGNCRWATMKQQCNNRRNNYWVTYQNQTLTLTQWAEKLEVPRARLRSRLGAGQPVERAFADLSDQRRRVA